MVREFEEKRGGDTHSGIGFPRVDFCFLSSFRGGSDDQSLLALSRWGREWRWLCVVPSRIWASLLREEEEGEVTKLVIACHGQDRFGEREGGEEGRDMRDVFYFAGKGARFGKALAL